jgi:hypothetical protein
MKFLDDGPADRLGVFAFDDDSTACPVDDLFHQYVAALIGSTVGLPNVLIAEISKDIFDYVLELEPREIV